MSENKRDRKNLIKKMLIGAGIGFLLSIFGFLLNGVTMNFGLVIEYSLYIQIAIIIIFFLPVLFWIRGAKQLFNQLDDSIDVDEDPNREKGEQMLFRALMFNRLFVVLSFISVGLAFDFDNPYFIASMLVFLLVLLPGSMNEVKIVRLIQKKDPMKKGDPTSLKFNSDYFSSLDEGEKVQVYQATYHTFIFMELTLIVLFTLSIFLKLYFDVGNGPMLAIGLIWLIQSIVYFYYSKKFSKSQTFV